MKTISARIGRVVVAVALGLLAFTFIQARAHAQGEAVVVNETNCYVELTWPSSPIDLRVAPNSKASASMSCSEEVVYVVSCGLIETVKLGECRTLNVGGCCAQVCFSPGPGRCQFLVTFTPVKSLCPCDHK